MGFGTDALQFLNGFRKWSVAILAMLISTGLVLFDFISGDNYATIISTVIPAFMGANLLEHGKEALMAWLERKSK